MFWLYLLGVVTVLVIILRRVLRRQGPLRDDLIAKKLVIDHVHSGVAWVPEDGKLGWLNPALPEALLRQEKHLIGHNWYELFAADEHESMRAAYREMLLRGKATVEARCVRADGTFAWFDVILVAIYDHKMRFVGHHCITENRSRERALEQHIQEGATHISVVELGDDIPLKTTKRLIIGPAASKTIVAINET